MMHLFAVAVMLMFASGAAFAAYSATVFVRTSCTGISNCYTNPATAVSNITDASSSNIYLVDVGPGTFDIGVNNTITMKSYVDIIGAGQDETTIKGYANSGGPSYYSVIKGADNAKLESLTVESYQAHYVSMAIHNESGAPSITNVKAIAHGSSYSKRNIAIQNEKSVVLDYVTAVAYSEGSYARNDGIVNKSGASLTLNNSTVDVWNSAIMYKSVGILNESGVSSVSITNSFIYLHGNVWGEGIYNYDAPVTIKFSKVITDNASSAIGIYSYKGDLTVVSSKIIAQGALGTNYGIHAGNGATSQDHVIVDIDRSLVEGSDVFIYALTYTDVYFNNSYLIGDSTANGNIDITVSTVDGSLGGYGTYSCVGVYDSSLDPVTCP